MRIIELKMNVSGHSKVIMKMQMIIISTLYFIYNSVPVTFMKRLNIFQQTGNNFHVLTDEVIDRVFSYFINFSFFFVLICPNKGFAIDRPFFTSLMLFSGRLGQLIAVLSLFEPLDICHHFVNQ